MLYDAPCFGRVTVLCWLVRIWRCREPACPAGTLSEAHDVAPPRMVLTTRAVAWATSALSYDDTTVSSFQPDWEISPRPLGNGSQAALDAVSLQAAGLLTRSRLAVTEAASQAAVAAIVSCGISPVAR
jgi:hypothetical protein